MKVLYYTSGVTGSGRVVRGISIGNALRRKGIKADFTILSSPLFAHLADAFNITHYDIPVESEEKLTGSTYMHSELYQVINSLKPDVLIVDLLWFPLYHFIHDLPCKKIFLCRQVDDRFFNISMPDKIISFRLEDYDYVLAIEPFTCMIPLKEINPIILRNRNEILSRKTAFHTLGIDDGNKKCLVAYSGPSDNFKKIKKKYSYMENEGYEMVYTANYKNNIFPVVDYFNAFDLIICGAGYNAFWEVIFFKKKAIIVPELKSFEDQKRRISECQDYRFDMNGADQLVDVMLKL